MDKEPTGKPTAGTHGGAGPTAAEESLSEALSGLERILERRQRPPRKAPKPTDPKPTDPEPPEAPEQPKPPADGQYTIPLLHDVVVPGSDLPETPSPDQGPADSMTEDAEETEAYRRLAERLANEIEVIVQTRVEAAVQKAAEDIREQVHNHLEIMLPEIIEDLKVLGRGPRG